MSSINLQSQYIASLFGLSLTNTFLTSLLVTLLLVVLSICFYLQTRYYPNRKNFLFTGMRVLLLKALQFSDGVTQDRVLSKKIMPLVATFFLFIVTANMLTLVPGFLGSFFIQTPAGNLPLLRSPNSDLTTTLALAVCAVVGIQFFSLQTLGARKYIGRFFSLASPTNFFLGFFELLSEAIKILSFSFRLFGNLFAGEVLLLVAAFLTPYVIPLPFMLLEVFVGVIQAFIFAILTLSFIKVSSMQRSY
jgi:F-type H+-transporting ATPase subunit a